MHLLCQLVDILEEYVGMQKKKTFVYQAEITQRYIVQKETSLINVESDAVEIQSNVSRRSPHTAAHGCGMSRENASHV